MNKDFFIGIDSDGTAFDSMTIKHQNAFIPVFIEVWGYEEYSAKIFEICEHINLYSDTRGTDRFSGLLLEFETMKKCGIRTPNYADLKGFLENGRLSNEGLSKYISENDSAFLKDVLEWSSKADDLFKREVKALQPFKGVKTVLEKAYDKADIAVISSATEESLKIDWQKQNLIDNVSKLFGQEFGGKREQLETAAKGKYEDGKVMMIGDAIGDFKAAHSVNAWFYPIIPAEEEKSWELLLKTYLDKFFAGSFNKDTQKILIEKFYKSLGE